MAKSDKKTMVETHGLGGLYAMVDPEMAGKMGGGLPPDMQMVMNAINQSNATSRLTGQLMVMRQSNDTNGREMYAMFGVVAVPKGVLKDMHKYPVVGMPRGEHIDIIFSTEDAEDRNKLSGMGIAGIMCSPEWRV